MSTPPRRGGWSGGPVQDGISLWVLFWALLGGLGAFIIFLAVILGSH